jgi:hypothetical protein
MINPNVFERETNILSLLLEYEQILLNHGALTHISSLFNKDHLLVSGNFKPVSNPFTDDTLKPLDISRKMPQKKPSSITLNIESSGVGDTTSAVQTSRLVTIYNFLHFEINKMVNYSSSKQ